MSAIAVRSVKSRGGNAGDDPGCFPAKAGAGAETGVLKAEAARKAVEIPGGCVEGPLIVGAMEIADSTRFSVCNMLIAARAGLFPYRLTNLGRHPPIKG